MDVQSAANLNIPEGSVRNIHDKDKRSLWSAVGYDVRYDGDTTQQTYSGKNKVVFPASTNSSSGVDWVITNDTITGSGTGTTNWSLITNHITFSTPLPAGTYTFSIPEAVANIFQINIKDTDGVTHDYSIGAGNKSVTFTSSYTGYSYRVAYRTDASAVSVSIPNKLQLEAGSTPTAFEPYVGGIPAPNPDYPQDVNVVKGKQNVLVSAKNLLSVSFAVAGGVPSDIPTNTFVLNRESQRFFRCDFPTLLPPGTYTISFDISDNNTLSGVSFNIFNKSETSISGAYNLSGSHYSGTFTFNESVKIIRWFIASNEPNDKHATISNVQIEAGSTATAYEMYQGQQTFPVDLIGKNLLSPVPFYTGGSLYNRDVGVTFTSSSSANVTVTITGNTTTISSNTAWAGALFVTNELTNGSTYTLSGSITCSIVNGLRASIYVLDSNYTVVRRINNVTTGNSVNLNYHVTIGSGEKYIAVSILCNTANYTDTCTNLQVELSPTATPYVPYYNYELCKIGNYQDYIFKSSGKNLFDGVLEVGIINGNTGLDQANNNYVRAEDYIPVEELTYYRISTDNANISSVFVYEYKADKTYNLTANKSLTLTDVYRTEEDTAFIRFRPNYQTTDTSIKFQVEKGTVATPYEPYGTDWYVCEKMGKLVFNGSESWTISNSGTVNFYYSLKDLNLGFTQNTQDLVSNYGLPGLISNTNAEQGIIIVSASGNQLRIRYGTEMTVANWQSKLSTTNMVLYYARKTPTYTKITDSTLISQLNALRDWLTRYDYYGVVTGNLPMIINRTGLT